MMDDSNDYDTVQKFHEFSPALTIIRSECKLDILYTKQKYLNHISYEFPKLIILAIWCSTSYA